MSARVLVVEDESALSQLLSYNLSKEGFAVFVCADGDEAEAAVDAHQPDIVLLDWMLPNVSGIEICRRLRAGKATRELPIIMLTARGEEEDRVRGLDQGADDYLTKPFSMTELAARMRALLRRAKPAVAGNVTTFHDITLDRDTMRVCFDIPKAWILFAAWKTMTRRDADTGKLEHWAVEQHDLDDEAVWDFMRQRVRPYLYRLLDNEMHASLHHVCHGMDGMFWTGEDDAPDEPEDPKSPF